MSDLGDAIKTFREWQARYENHLPSQCPHPAALDAIISAYLTGHPEDDDDLVTAQWLKSVGGCFIITSAATYVIAAGMVQIAICTLSGALQIWIASRKASGIQTTVAQVIESGCSRGDVRRLCAAVGHQLDG